MLVSSTELLLIVIIAMLVMILHKLMLIETHLAVEHYHHSIASTDYSTLSNAYCNNQTPNQSRQSIGPSLSRWE